MEQKPADVRQSVAEALFEAACTIKIRKKDLMKWPDDDEHLHQYRIAVRVARSLVKFLKPHLDRTQCQQLKDQLKTLQDPTSRMRELDVLVPLLANDPALQERCRNAQRETRTAFIAQLKAPETQELLGQVEDGLKHIAWKKSVRRDGIDPAELASRIEARRATCEKTLAVVDFDDQEAVHDLRKQAKALRYVSRELEACLPEGAAATSGQMRKVQDKLGAWCDARVNAALVAEICGPDAAATAARFQAEADAIMQSLKEGRTQ